MMMPTQDPEGLPATRVYRGLSGDGIEEFIRQFLASAREDPFGSWLILPTERLVRTVTGTVAGAGHLYIPTRVCTLERFCEHYFEEHRTTERLLTPGEVRLLLGQVLTEKKRLLPLFSSRNRPSPGTIDELLTFIRVLTRRKIAYPECLLELQNDKSNQIETIITEYQSRLRSHNLLDSDTLVGWVIDHLTTPGPVPLGSVYLYGLFDPLPLEQDLLSAIREDSGRFSVFIPEGRDPVIFPSEVPWAGEPGSIVSVPPSSPRAGPLTGLFRPGAEIDSGGVLRAATFPTRYREIRSIAGEIARLHAGGTPYYEIAVAFPDVRAQLPVVQEIFSDFCIPWNSATGTRLVRSPLIGFLLSLAEIVSDRYPRERIVRLVGNPYFRSQALRDYGLTADEVDLASRLAQIEGGESGWKDGLDRYLARVTEETRGEPNSCNREMVRRVRDGMIQLFRDLAPLSSRATIDKHRKNFTGLIDRWGLWHPPASGDGELLQEEHAALAKFRECLNSLDRTTSLLTPAPVGIGEFLSTLFLLAREVELPPSWDGTGVALLGIRECVHEHFPFLFIAGLTEGEMPRLTTRLPLTNTLENRRMGTRSLEDILREERYYFVAALLAGRDRVYLSAPQSDGGKVLLSSAFFERVREAAAVVPWGQEDYGPSPSLQAESIRAGEMIARGEICGSLAHLPPEDEIDELAGRITIERFYRRGGYDSPYEGMLAEDAGISSALGAMYGPGHVYSPTVLETYAECPFRFFLQRVVRIQPLPELEPNLLAKDRGTAVHKVLSSFYREWRRLGHKKVTAVSLAEATELILRIGAEELGRHPSGSPLWDATRIQMTGGGEDGPGIFVQFLETEVLIEPSPLVPSLFEFSFGIPEDPGDDPASVEEPVELASREETIRIQGRIDRIDITPDGRFSISDYKTGSHVVSKKEIEAGRALQLPLYLGAYEKISGMRGVAAGYYRIRRKVENRIVLCDESVADLIATSRIRTSEIGPLLTRSLEFAVDYIHKIRAGAFPLVAEERCPNRHCEFRFTCRFDPARVFSLKEGE
jgi:ATP-dependent helicase/DNAse subunit B